MSHAEIDVIVPVFNGEKYIAEAIESVLCQSLSPASICIVDDGSSDMTLAVVDNYRDHVSVITQANSGAGSARNAGIKATSSPYVAFLDADDTWLENCLESLARVLLRDEQNDCAIGLVEQYISPDLSKQEASQLDCHEGLAPAYCPGGILITRSIFDRVGVFDERFRLGEFIDWYHHAASMGVRFGLAGQQVLKRRIHLTNTGRTRKDMRSNYAAVARQAIQRRRKLELGGD